jgi:hypothetical protein
MSTDTVSLFRVLKFAADLAIAANECETVSPLVFDAVCGAHQAVEAAAVALRIRDRQTLGHVLFTLGCIDPDTVADACDSLSRFARGRYTATQFVSFHKSAIDAACGRAGVVCSNTLTRG